MAQKQKYMVVSEKGLTAFNDACKYRVSLGWVAQGGVSVTVDRVGENARYSQAFVINSADERN